MLRRGSVVAAFLLCFLAKVRGLLEEEEEEEDGGGEGSLDRAVWMYSDYMCAASYVHGHANVTCPHANKVVITISLLQVRVAQARAPAVINCFSTCVCVCVL